MVCQSGGTFRTNLYPSFRLNFRHRRDVKLNKKSRNPAYVVTIDFGEELGIKKSSAQIMALYSPEDLLGRQVICCVNLTPMHIGSVKSEVRILGTDSEQGVVLLMPTEMVKNGD